MNRTIENIEAKLNEKIPESAVKTRKQGGMELAYLDAYYVINRMNDIFGSTYWSHTVQNLQSIPNTDQYTAHVRVAILMPDGRQILKDGIGFGSIKGNGTHEIAVKEAETDALKRAVMRLGLSMGLALYDKSFENVQRDGEEAKASSDAPAAPPSTEGGGSGNNEAVIKNNLISSLKLLAERKEYSKEKFQEYLTKKYNKNKVGQLTEQEASAVLREFRENFKALQ